jgi:hypothetical protein
MQTGANKYSLWQQLQIKDLSKATNALSMQLFLEEWKQNVADLILYHRLYCNQFEK